MARRLRFMKFVWFQAVADVIKTWGWKNFVVIYENNESLVRISSLLKPEVTDAAGVQIIQLPATQDYRLLRVGVN